MEVHLTVKEFKEGFFDRITVYDRSLEYTMKKLSRQGAIVMTIARRSMRRKLGPSLPGNPPNAHLGLMRDLLFFAFDRSSFSVVVGPAVIAGGGVAPGLHEEGGVVQNKRPFGPRVFVYPPRAYMKPALTAANDIFTDIWG
jgi:hypothetical protein